MLAHYGGLIWPTQAGAGVRPLSRRAGAEARRVARIQAPSAVEGQGRWPASYDEFWQRMTDGMDGRVQRAPCPRCCRWDASSATPSWKKCSRKLSTWAVRMWPPCGICSWPINCSTPWQRLSRSALWPHTNGLSRFRV